MPKAALVAAEDIAISDNCSAVGFGLIAQSPKTVTLLGKHIKKIEDTIETSGLVLIN